MDTIILYDLPSRDPLRCWSLNPWKTRLVLNYKKLDYQTIWIEYPEIAPTFKNVGIPPNAEGTPYTIPTIRFPDHGKNEEKWVMDSSKIVTELEKRYPDPPLHLDSPILAEIEEIRKTMALPLSPILMPRIPRSILNQASVNYFNETRSKRLGMPLDEFEKSEKGGEAAYRNAEPVLRKIAELLRQNGGPFFMGRDVSYSDFIVVGFFRFLHRLGNDVFERVMDIDNSFPRLYNACQPWLERDDH